MPTPRKPQPGEPAFPFLGDTEMWSTLIEIIAKYRAGDFGARKQSGRSPVTIRGRNARVAVSGSGDSAIIAKSTLQVLGDIGSPPMTSSDVLKRLFEKKPTFELVDPVWHTSIDKVFPVPRDVPPNTTVPFYSQRYIVADVPGITVTDRYVMVDPDEPTALKGSGESGIYGVMGISHDDVAILDTRDSQPIWRYEMTAASGAPGDTAANLQTMEGTTFGAIQLSDPLGLMDDQANTDLGYCLHVGNKFYAIQGVC